MGGRLGITIDRNVRRIYEVEKYIKEYQPKRRTFFVHPDMLYIIDGLNYGFEVNDVVVSEAFPKFEYQWISPISKNKYYDWGDDYELLQSLGLGTIKFSDDKIWYKVKNRENTPSYKVWNPMWAEYKKLPAKYDTPIVTHFSRTKVLVRP